jgi:hypothetical protein
MAMRLGLWLGLDAGAETALYTLGNAALGFGLPPVIDAGATVVVSVEEPLLGGNVSEGASGGTIKALIGDDTAISATKGAPVWAVVNASISLVLNGASIGTWVILGALVSTLGWGDGTSVGDNTRTPVGAVVNAPIGMVVACTLIDTWIRLKGRTVQTD